MPKWVSKLKSLLKSGIHNVVQEDSASCTPPSDESLRLGFEPKDANISGVTVAVVTLIVLGALIQMGMGYSFSLFKNKKMNETESESIPPSDFLQRNEPEKGLLVYRSEMKRVLDSYGWVDREKKIVRIPIEKAMERRAREN
jgi:hypothetical protein